MARFTLPRDLYHGKGALEALKTLKGKKAIVVVGGGSMKRFGFLDKVVSYLKEAGTLRLHIHERYVRRCKLHQSYVPWSERFQAVR
jgi:alcohol dehydrogenase class IV